MSTDLTFIPPEDPSRREGWDLASEVAKRIQPLVGEYRLRPAHDGGLCLVAFSRKGDFIGAIHPGGRSDEHIVLFINNCERWRQLAFDGTPAEIVKAFWDVVKDNPRAQLKPTDTPDVPAFRPRKGRHGCRIRLLNGEAWVRLRTHEIYIGATHFQVTGDTHGAYSRDMVERWDRKDALRAGWLADMLTTVYCDLVGAPDLQVL